MTVPWKWIAIGAGVLAAAALLWWLVGPGGGILGVVGGAGAALLGGRRKAVPPVDLVDDVDELAGDHLEAVEAKGQAAVAAAKKKAAAEIAAADQELEEHANAPADPDDPADWTRPRRRDD